MLDSDCLNKLFEFASQDSYLHLKLESCWSLANLMNGNSWEIEFLVNKGIVEIFRKCLYNTYMVIVE